MSVDKVEIIDYACNNTKVVETFYFNDFHELEQWKVDRNRDLYDNKEISLHTLLNVCLTVSFC